MKLKNIINNLAFTNITLANEEEIKQIRSIRNEKNIRKNMKNQKIILSKEHYKWFKSFKTSKTNFFYVIKYKNKIIGGLGLKNYNSNLLPGEWSFYVSEKQIFIGLGASIEIKAIEFFFEKFKLKSLYCFVLKHNIDIIKLHYKFGFLEILAGIRGDHIKYTDLTISDLNTSLDKDFEIKGSQFLIGIGLSW